MGQALPKPQGQEARRLCFEAIRTMLLVHAPPLRIADDQDTLLELVTPELEGKPSERFARLQLGEEEVQLQMVPVGLDRNGANALSTRLQDCRRGAHQFAFVEVDSDLGADIGRMIEVRASICRARGLMA